MAMQTTLFQAIKTDRLGRTVDKAEYWFTPKQAYQRVSAYVADNYTVTLTDTLTGEVETLTKENFK